MVAIITVELLFIIIVKLWPLQEDKIQIAIYHQKELLVIEEMMVTKQANTPAAPPKPQIPIPVPNDEIIEDFIVFPDLEQLISFDSLSITNTTGQKGDEEIISGNPDKKPIILRIVEPTLSAQALNSGIKSMVIVNFLVSSEGTVREAYIAEIRLYKEHTHTYETVYDLGFSILQDVLDAAYKWKFKPAIEGDKKISAYIQETFLIGF
jgi:protein TonB